jgi:hypothetical protein
MEELAVYVVRIYRRDAARMAGVVESVASGEQLPFQTTEQLWHALHDLPSSRRNFLDGKPNEEGGT